MIINVDEHNIGSEHICCAVSGGDSKKDWMRERFEDGLVFKRLNARGKVFIEYIPAENAWAPVTAPDYMYINCLWVSGKFKGQGYSNKLLEECIDDAKSKNKAGLALLSSTKKKPFLSDPDYFKHKGFRVADTAEPYYELLYLPFHTDSAVPSFKEFAKDGVTDGGGEGFLLYYSNQCPFAEKYALSVSGIAKQSGFLMRLIKAESREDAQNVPNPFPTYALFYNSKFITNEILSEKSFSKLLSSL